MVNYLFLEACATQSAPDLTSRTLLRFAYNCTKFGEYFLLFQAFLEPLSVFKNTYLSPFAHPCTKELSRPTWFLIPKKGPRPLLRGGFEVLWMLFKKSTFDHEADQDAYSTSNMEFSRNFRCSQKFPLRSAPHFLASSHLGAENRTF
ncbi:MAG: hypothetical protein K0Q94_5351 [Paenibacillus sp.]|jgi:hypothetical protein|nr:hypothetical protein [Paenibacillus sp.]